MHNSIQHNGDQANILFYEAIMIHSQPTQEQQTPNLKLISHALCPYVQRSIILLTEQKVLFQRTDIDLANKPDWFKQISPLGKVPVLLVENNMGLFESQVICEYLDEISPDSLHPEGAFNKARHRAWIEFGSGLLASIASPYSAKDQAGFNQQLNVIQFKLGQLESQLEEGPYFSGEAFQIIDAVYGPIFRYFDSLEKIVEFNFFSELNKVTLWRQALAERPSIKTAVVEDYPERLWHFLKTRQSYLASIMT